MSEATDGNAVVVSATGLTKIYSRGREYVRAVEDVSLEVQRGDFVAIVGPSGAGKTTLLNLIGCMDAPTAGSLRLLCRPAEDLDENERTQLRREKLGFVFQQFGLLSTLTVAENVALPAFFAGRKAPQRLEELLARVGLEHRRDHRPTELSGGEMQRVAIARALINQPQLLLADEPTGNLDRAGGQGIIALFQELNREGLTIMVATHNPALAAAAGRRIEMQDGRIQAVSEGPITKLEFPPVYRRKQGSG